MTPVAWLGIEIRHLVALATVARTGSFRGAAEELGYVQSAISQQIAQLERVIGQRLVERSRGEKHVELTHAGAMLLAHVDEIMARFRAAQADVAAALDQTAGELNVGFLGGLIPRLLPTMLERLDAVAPDLTLLPHEATSDQTLFESLAQGALDMAFVELPIEPGPYEHHAFAADPWVLLVQADSPLARRDGPIDLADLARLPLIAPSGSRSYERLETLLNARGLAPRIALRAPSELTVQPLVGSGVGVAILPRLCVDASDPRVTAITLDCLPPRSIALCWQRNRLHTCMLRTVSELAEEAIADLLGTSSGAAEREVVAGIAA